MMAVPAGMPQDPSGWGFEFKWDGVRAVVFWDGRELRLQSRNLLEMTPRYPELAGLGKALGRSPTMLDAEIIALDDRGRPSFPALQHRMHVADPAAIQRLVGEVPAYLVIFDLLHRGRNSLMSLPLEERRAMLEGLKLAAPHWRISPMQVGHGAAMLEVATAQQLEGLVAKRMDSVYEPGRRSPTWRKIKLIQRQELVIGGWVPEKGAGTSRIGALLMGYYAAPAGRGTATKPGGLIYAGSVGTGFTDQVHRDLSAQLRDIERKGSPFAARLPRRDARFVEPKLVAEIEYRRWPVDGLLQQAAYKGLRHDKDPRQVTDERRPITTSTDT